MRTGGCGEHNEEEATVEVSTMAGSESYPLSAWKSAETHTFTGPNEMNSVRGMCCDTTAFSLLLEPVTAQICGANNGRPEEAAPLTTMDTPNHLSF